MGEELKILIIGLGSIGRRHVSILKLQQGITIAALRTKKGEINIPSEVQEFYTIKEALLFKPHGVIISNPTSLHVETALPFLEQGIKVLIEKPIGSNLNQVFQLEKFAENIRVAYCLRFSELSNKLSEIFKNDLPYKITFRRSYFLPNWHPEANYSNEYTAKKELGGGVIRTLSHELDLAISLFNEPISVTGVIDRLSFLNIDTDDFAFFTMKTKLGSRINFELDFYSPVNKNEGEAFTVKGHYTWNPNQLNFMPYDSNLSTLVYKFSENSLELMYNCQLTDFLDFIKMGNSKNATFKDALSVMKIIDNVEKQS